MRSFSNPSKLPLQVHSCLSEIQIARNTRAGESHERAICFSKTHLWNLQVSRIFLHVIGFCCPIHNCTRTQLCPNMTACTRPCPNMTVPKYDCALTRLCPYRTVPLHDCVHTQLCANTTVPKHDCAHTRLCSYTTVLIYDSAHT